MYVYLFTDMTILRYGRDKKHGDIFCESRKIKMIHNYQTNDGICYIVQRFYILARLVLRRDK